MRRIVLFLLVLSCASPFGIAQGTASTEQETLEAILKEIRELRQAMESSALLGAKLQLASLRVGLQEERVARASDAVAKAQSDLDTEVQLRAQLTEQVKQLQAEFDTTGGSEERRRITAQIDEFKTRAANGLIEDGLRAKVNEASSQLQSAQTDLAKVQRELDQVERSIDRAPGR